MRWIFLFLSVVAGCEFSGLLTYLASSEQVFHKICMNSIPKGLSHLELALSLGCGAEFSNRIWKELLISSSLIHLIVVSGAHFALLTWILEKIFLFWPTSLLKYKFATQFFLLLIYWLATRTQPPATLGLGLWILSQKGPRGISRGPGGLLWYCPLLALAMPSALNSASYYLSWLCSLCLRFSFFQKTNFLGKKELELYLGLQVFGVWASWGSPWGILMNLIFGPGLSIVLFPLVLLLIPLPHLDFLWNTLTEFLLSSLKQFSPSTPPPLWSWPKGSSPLWPYLKILTLNFLVYFVHRELRRKNLKET